MSYNPNSHCVCQSGKPFIRCCLPFLSGKKYPPTPEKLMRSRFTAYAMGGYGEYLLESWLPELTQGLDAAQLALRDTDWKALRVIESRQRGEVATVLFEADYAEKNGVVSTYREKSHFTRMHGRWLYAGIAVE